MKLTIMNTTLGMFILLFANIGFSSFGQTNNTVATCCATVRGRCTGSANCNVCSNCSKCGYCNSGGSCGVCAGSGTRSYLPTYTTQKHRKTYHGNSGVYSRVNNPGVENYKYFPNDTSSKFYLKSFLVKTKSLNLRTGPGTIYQVIEKLFLNDEIIFLGNTGDWIKVENKLSGNVGFVYSKFISIK